ncbi:hypothetical protein TGVAND_238450 [Toxoplasma gondii VAND]|uniref:Uncharacterized protein n=1 Tax=Toxoplasma gondii VAND TaxID=933077 RepID=A0A086PGU2_TOXGO|nr:hypothetical protein TGVAND_238450 [Toxoplasma gondii VAND]
MPTRDHSLVSGFPRLKTKKFIVLLSTYNHHVDQPLPPLGFRSTSWPCGVLTKKCEAFAKCGIGLTLWSVDKVFSHMSTWMLRQVVAFQSASGSRMFALCRDTGGKGELVGGCCFCFLKKHRSSLGNSNNAQPLEERGRESFNTTTTAVSYREALPDMNCYKCKIHIHEEGYLWSCT